MATSPRSSPVLSHRETSEQFCNVQLQSPNREFIRFLGQVKTARNPSALLMARIRRVFPAFVVLDAEARQHWNYPRELPKPTVYTVWILVRGESNREGWNHQHGTAGSSDTFQANMFAYLRHLVQPLEAQGFHVVVCGDLRISSHCGWSGGRYRGQVQKGVWTTRF